MSTDERPSTRPEPIGFRDWLVGAVRFRLPWLGAAPDGRSSGRQQLVKALAVVAMCALVFGAWSVLRPKSHPDIATLLPRAASSPVSSGAAGSSASGPATGAKIVVHVVGAVIAPGVVQVPGGSRVLDAVAAAGGAASDADLSRVNLAAKLADGQRVVVPRQGDTSPVLATGDSGGADAPAGENVEPVDLNNATAVQLDALPGVGPATAAAIIAYRTQHGPFRTVDALGDVKGIGTAKLEQLRPLVTV
jgi:competence protein ComEA